MVPRDKRPSPESLIGYTSTQDPEPDYDAVLIERGIWLSDWQREAEENRERDASGQTALPGHADLSGDAPSGYDPETFSLQSVLRTVAQRPHH